MSYLSKSCGVWLRARGIAEHAAAANSFVAVPSVRPALRIKCSCELLSLVGLLLAAPASVVAQNNSFATVIQNNATMQSNLTKQMINLGGTSPSHGTSAGPAACMPPVELARGPSGVVPPELQGDPRYQEYLRCRQGQSGPQNALSSQRAPPLPLMQHLPLTATDFVPVEPGHPIIDQAIDNMPITPEERRQVRSKVGVIFQRVAAGFRSNNLAVSVGVAYSTARFTLDGRPTNREQDKETVFGINDKLARGPLFPQMSSLEKQNNSDSLIFQAALISVLREMGQRDPQARQQAIELSRALVHQLTGS
jgi:hypothetical protein